MPGPALVLLGVLVGLAVDAVLARHTQLPVVKTLLLSAGASFVGLAGGKGYFLLLHRERQAAGLPQTGLAIQGFVLATMATATGGAAVVGLSVRSFLDNAAVALLVGLAIGRWGCFYGGCCTGRLTSSRWGRWSSDRTLGARRIPAQVLESVMAALLAALAATGVWLEAAKPAGTVFVGALAAYTLGRQLLFPLRSLPRMTRSGRSWVLIAASGVLVLDLTTVLMALVT